MKRGIYFLLLVAPLFSYLSVQAQGSSANLRRAPALQVGMGMGALWYHGDLNYQREAMYRPYPGFRLSAQFDNERRVSPQLNVFSGRFSAENRDLGPTDGIQPNTYARTQVLTADVRLLIRILKDTRVRPHLGLGLGMLVYEPNDATGNSLVNNINTRAADETYGSLTIQVPFVLGVQYKVNDLVALGLDLTHVATNTDYLDNIGQLGPRDSNDRLQTLLFSVYLSPGQKERQGRR